MQSHAALDDSKQSDKVPYAPRYRNIAVARGILVNASFHALHYFIGNNFLNKEQGEVVPNLAIASYLVGSALIYKGSGAFEYFLMGPYEDCERSSTSAFFIQLHTMLGLLVPPSWPLSRVSVAVALGAASTYFGAKEPLGRNYFTNEIDSEPLEPLEPLEAVSVASSSNGLFARKNTDKSHQDLSPSRTGAMLL